MNTSGEYREGSRVHLSHTHRQPVVVYESSSFDSVYFRCLRAFGSHLQQKVEFSESKLKCFSDGHRRVREAAQIIIISIHMDAVLRIISLIFKSKGEVSFAGSSAIVHCTTLSSEVFE